MQCLLQKNAKWQDMNCDTAFTSTTIGWPKMTCLLWEKSSRFPSSKVDHNKTTHLLGDTATGDPSWPMKNRWKKIRDKYNIIKIGEASVSEDSMSNWAVNVTGFAVSSGFSWFV